MEKKHITIALTGNPNAGKTTIFNALTGTRQKVGNWAGVTVEKKEGVITHGTYEIHVVDLPGTYSLTPFSMEEIIARNFIIDESPDVVVNIIDASNIERNLYLATQIRELDCKVLFVLNMADLAASKGVRIDAAKLSELLDVEIVYTVGNKGEGVTALLEKAVRLAEEGKPVQPERRVRYNRDIEAAIADLQSMIDAQGGLFYNSRWIAIKLLERDEIVSRRVSSEAGAAGKELLKKADVHRGRLADLFDDDLEIIMTDERYGFIAGFVKEVVTITKKNRVDLSRNIDLVLTNKFFGFPIFIFFIWLMFQLTFSVGAYPMEAIEKGFALLFFAADRMLSDGLFKDFIRDGVLAGVGSVAVFLPNILILFFCIALLEDTGYMARAAFLMDRIMHLIGLHGKSFIPMLMGFGCSVPAVMATRTLGNRKDRILTILITPFMSCSARLPVYIVLAGTFFPNAAGTVIFLIYLSGIVIAMISGRIFRSLLLRGEDAPFVMELPPYRAPMIKGLLIHMWDRARQFLKKMGGVILIGSIIVWGLSVFPRDISFSKDYAKELVDVQNAYQLKMDKIEDQALMRRLASERDEAVKNIIRAREKERTEKVYMGRIGKAIAPFFEPLGIDWRGSVSLLTGFVAKEIVVSSMGVLYAVEGHDQSALGKALRSSGMTPLSALSMMVFVLLYIPCLATVLVIMRETGAAKWALFNIVYSTSVAWSAAFIVYQTGLIFTAG
ncbi:MAG: ferrous iron transport protein B [Thermodesulfobacteriota bacterium]